MKKKVLAALLAVCMVASMLLVPAMAADEGTFSDVDADAWYASSIERWTKAGVLNGMPGGTFQPESAMNRAQFAKVVVELLGLSTEGVEMPFEDVKGTTYEWAEKEIAAAYNAGIIKGATATKFNPGNPVSFNQAALMMTRAVGMVVPGSDADNYAGAVAALEEHGMLDENVKADMAFDRAGVAGLADKMIGKYVAEGYDAEAEDGVITGEVQGVILVKGDVSVEIKDATVTAPIVVQGASVELTGKTTAAEIKVAGDKASVTAGAETKIEAIAVEGTEATVKVDGEVKSVTVAEDATVAEIAGEGVSKDNVTNNSAEEIRVNDEPVAGKPAETDPDPDEGQGESTGFVPDPVKPVEQPEAEKKPEATTPEVPAADKGTVTKGEAEGATEPSECDGHEWGDATTTLEATCTTTGTATYTCSKCKGVSTVTIPALVHKWYKASVTPATCTEQGTITWACANTGCTDKKFPAVGQTPATNDEKFAALGHTQVNFAGQAATCTNWGLGTGIMCGRDGCDMHHVIAAAAAPSGRATDNITLGTTEPTITANKWFQAPTKLAPLGHNYEKKVTGTGDDAVTTYVCSRCDDEQENCPNAPHSSILNTATCPICGEKGTKVPPVAHTAQHTVSYDSSKSNLITDTQHPTKCGTANCDYTAGTMVDHTWGKWTSETNTTGEGEGAVTTTTYKHTCTGCQHEVSTTTKPADYDTNNADTP